MRASEFVTEAKRGKVLDAVSKTSPGTSFTAGDKLDLYRASQLMARLPGDIGDIDPYSFVTGRPMIVAYTKEEKKMVKDAFKAMGIDYHEQMNHGSEEPEGVNNTSPTQGFKGYPR